MTEAEMWACFPHATEDRTTDWRDCECVVFAENDPAGDRRLFPNGLEKRKDIPVNE